jgi:hypothetical protein
MPKWRTRTYYKGCILKVLTAAQVCLLYCQKSSKESSIIEVVHVPLNWLQKQSSQGGWYCCDVLEYLTWARRNSHMTARNMLDKIGPKWDKKITSKVTAVLTPVIYIELTGCEIQKKIFI